MIWHIRFPISVSYLTKGSLKTTETGYIVSKRLEPPRENTYTRNAFHILPRLSGMCLTQRLLHFPAMSSLRGFHYSSTVSPARDAGSSGRVLKQRHPISLDRPLSRSAVSEISCGFVFFLSTDIMRGNLYCRLLQNHGVA